MSILTVKVCEECGKQTTDGDGWLVMSSIEIRSAGTRDELMCSDVDLDLCSHGCLLRYISRNLEKVQTRHPVRKSENVKDLIASRAA